MRIHMSMCSTIAVAAALAVGTTAAAQDTKATEVLAGARNAIGRKKLDALSSLSVQAATQRNVGNFQMTADLELLLNLPDKYVRSETASGPMVNMANATGFNGDRPIRSRPQGGMPQGGGMIIRMGGPGLMAGSGETPTPEQQEQIDKQMVRSAKQEIGRLMLGWFAMAHPSFTLQYTYGGEAQSPDGKAFIVDAKSNDGFSARLFVDEATHLPLMLTYQGPRQQIVTVGGPRPGDGTPPKNQTSPPKTGELQRVEPDPRREIEQQQTQAPATVEYTLYFDDWREEDGIRFPHSLRRASAGATMEEWTINKVRVNPKIDPKKFESEQ